MLHLVQSNKMESLAEQLFAWLKLGFSLKKHQFEADQVLVQSPGMAQWLKLQIAQHLGITANIDFPLPSSFIWQLYRQHIDGLPETSAFSKDNITWKLMAILPTLLHKPEFIVIQQYLNEDNDLKRYQLCHKIADVYDQYLVYRPDWLLIWEQGQDQLPDADISLHPWQPILWRALCEMADGLGESRFHRANLHTELLQKLTSGDSSEQHSPLYVFGISALPQQQLEVLNALAQTRDVVIFWANPSLHYWSDLVDEKTRARRRLKVQSEDNDFLDVGNPLLASWGKLGRDYQDMLLDLDLEQHDAFVTTNPETLLEHVQNEILELTFRGSQRELEPAELLSNGIEYPKLSLKPSDHSLHIHCCHSKVRELEVLHDQLLQQFEQDPELTPGDVIVMMPDVASYAPYIDGVFGGVDRSLYIPYGISDRSVGEESGILASFIQLMKLHQSRLTLSEVLSILEIPAIQIKFSISESEYEHIKFWLADVGIRWGWDEHDKQRWQLPTEPHNTWLFGLNRLLSGYAISGSGLFQTDHAVIAPYAELEGQQAAALGKFYQFSRILLEAVKFCRNADVIEIKVEGALAILDNIYLADESDQMYLNQVRQAIESLNSHKFQYEQSISQDIFVSELEQRLSDKGVGQRFLAGFVNFCTLMPMRSIPFRQVCILGLNDGEYPRQTLPVGFDLMREGKPRRGDRSRRLDDRYLFLEGILSARRYLYLSYIGFSQRDNTPRSCSILVNELIEYCRQTFCLEEGRTLDPNTTQDNITEHVIVEHNLQPFASPYFEQGSVLKASFQSQWLQVSKQQLQDKSQKPFLGETLILDQAESQHCTVMLDELIDFYNNPAKALFKQRWNTSLTIRQMSIVDEEPFHLDPLSRYQLNQRIIAGDDAIQIENIQAEGLLPGGNNAHLSYQKVMQQSESVSHVLAQLRLGRQPSRTEINLNLEQYELLGWVDKIYGSDLILWRPGKVRVKDTFALWITWLGLCAQKEKGELNQAHFIGLESRVCIPAIEPDIARQELISILDSWKFGLANTLHFYPETAWVWMKSQDRNKAVGEFEGSSFKSGEATEPHVARLCPDLNACFEDFSDCTQKLLFRLFDLVEGG